jgi:anti-anti-sigma factor
MTSECQRTSENDVPHDDSNAGRGDRARPFVGWRTHGPADVGWVRIEGVLDSGTAAKLKRTLRERRLRRRLVVLDLRELTFVDRFGVHAIVDAGVHARKAGRRLVVMHVAPEVRGMFERAGGSEDVEIADLHLVAPAVQGSLPPAGGGCAA